MSNDEDPQTQQPDPQPDQPKQHPCITPQCRGISTSPGWYCPMCQRQEAAQHQAKVSAYIDSLPPCPTCGDPLCDELH